MKDKLMHYNESETCIFNWHFYFMSVAVAYLIVSATSEHSRQYGKEA